ETRAIVEAADLVVFVGCRAGSVTTERWRFPAPGRVKVIHIDADPSVIGANYSTEVAIIGYAKLALADLRDELRLLNQPRPLGQLDERRIRRAREEKLAAFAALAQSDERPIRPERLVADLQAVTPRDALIVADPGTPCPYLSAYFQVIQPGRRLWSNRAH